MYMIPYIIRAAWWAKQAFQATDSPISSSDYKKSAVKLNALSQVKKKLIFLFWDLLLPVWNWDLGSHKTVPVSYGQTVLQFFSNESLVT